MFYVNREIDYALQFLLALHSLSNDHTLSLKQFSKESDISFLFLQKIARKLKQSGLINSTRGPGGGYRLKEGFEIVTLKDVVETITGPYGAANCLRKGKYCQKEETCTMRPAIEKMNQDIIAYMQGLRVVEMI